MVPELATVFESPEVSGALRSLLGPGYIMHTHKHSHRVTSSRPPQTFHRDSRWGYDYPRTHRPHFLLAFYYPQDTPLDLGPTELLSGSQVGDVAPSAHVQTVCL